MKNLANCTPKEFMTQTNKIRKSVSNWLTVTDVMNIRKHKPVYPEGITDEEKKELISEQAMQNINDMLDSILDKHPNETLELLALLCFVEPKKVNDHPMSEYIESLTELMQNQSVISFFMSLMRLVNSNGSKR